MLIKLLSTIDPSIGRIDKSTMSQQTLIELLVESVTTNKDTIIGKLPAAETITE